MLNKTKKNKINEIELSVLNCLFKGPKRTIDILEYLYPHLVNKKRDLGVSDIIINRDMSSRITGKNKPLSNLLNKGFVNRRKAGRRVEYYIKPNCTFYVVREIIEVRYKHKENIKVINTHEYLLSQGVQNENSD